MTTKPRYEASAYAEVSVVVDGALDESPTFYDDTALNAYLAEQEDEAASHGYPTEVFVMFHEHSPELDCECAQYETDHRAKYVYNVAGEVGVWQ